LHGFLEVFWAIILALFGALVMGGLVVGGTILGIGCAAFGCGWLVLRRRRRRTEKTRD
jgi:Flp pilus assembly protein TadB